MPVLTIIAGPNGCGKSTLTRSLAFPGKDNLFDPDAIAKGIAPGDPAGVALTAGRLALERRSECLANGIDFAIETTLAGAGVLTLMKQAKGRGFEINLIYVAVDDPERSVQRVRERVAQGGHSVPPEDVRRRYARSMGNVSEAIQIADASVLFDNSELRHEKILEAQRGIVLWTAPHLPGWARRVLSDLESSKAQQA